MSDASLFDDAQRAPGCTSENSRYVTLFERALDGIFQTDQQGYYLRVNPALATIYGYESTEALLMAQPIVNGQFYVDRTCRDIIRQHIAQEGRVTNYEFQAYRRDGSIIWLSETCWALYDSNGQTVCYEGFIKDITERKTTEAALQHSEQQSQAIVAAIPDLMFRVRWDGTYLGYISTNHFVDLLPDDYEPINQPLSKYLPSDVAERHLRHLQQALETNTIQIYEQQHHLENRIQHEEVRVVPIDATEVLFIIRDMTQQKQTEASLKQRNEELQAALQKLQQAQDELIQADKMVVLGQLTAGIAHEINTPLGAIQASSSNAVKALESSLPKLPALFELLDPKQTHLVFKLIEQSLQSTELTTAREKRQQRRSLTQQLAMLAVPNTATIADTLVDMGITTDLDPYLPLLQSEHSLFIVDLAYDLARIKRNSQTIQLAVGRAASVVRALKNFTYHDHTGQKTVAQVIDSIETVLTLYHNQLKHGIELTRHYEDVPPIPCYFDELGQIWTNLIQNAVQAMGGQGKIAIAVHCRLSNREDSPGDCVVVSITDNGPGIPPAIRSRIFDPFFTTKPIGAGTGLGLNISHKIVQKHNGWITLASEPGQTCFAIWLPIEEATVHGE
ncbi:MAG: ATP-binding protein [Cyanobacteria bacterium P01_F01_bin.86]